MNASGSVFDPGSMRTASQVTLRKTGAATGNADIEQYSYENQTGLLTNQKVYKASDMSNPLLDLSYEYNRGNSIGTLNGKTGQLTRIVNNLDRNKDRVYESDALGRLIKAKGGLATGITGVTADWTQDYSYDRYGNKTGTTATGITADSNAVPSDGLVGLGYNTASNRINTADWEYDLTGNLIRGQNESGVWQKFEYDEAGRLVKIMDDSNNVVENYSYGADRSRLVNETFAGKTYYAWGGTNPLVEYTEGTSSSTPVFAKSYVYAGSRLLSTATKNGSSEIVEFHHPDRLGTKLVTNPDADTFYEQATLPFGTALSAESSGFSNQTFTSYDRSAETGLDYAVNRTHSSGQGRFTQVDPLGMGAASSDPQSNNLYAYTQNIPTDFVDPSGLMVGFYDVSAGMTCVLNTNDGMWHCTEYINRYWFEYGSGGGGGGGGGGEGGEGGGGDSSPPTPKPSNEAIQNAVSDCIKELWGNDRTTYSILGDFTPASKSNNGSFQIQVNAMSGNSLNQGSAQFVTDVSSYSSTQLAKINRQRDPSDKRTWLAGYTSWQNGFEAGHNYIANDLSQRRNAGLETPLASIVGSHVAVQIHELGVGLGHWTGIDVKAKGEYKDTDNGMALEECVSGKLKE